MKIKSIMTTPVITVNETDSIRDAARLMETYRIGSIVVIDEHEHAIGIVTDRDIITRAIAYDVSLDSPINQIMSKRLYVVFEDEEITLATYFMGVKQVRRMIVLARDLSLRGMISLGDIAKTGEFDYQVQLTNERISYPYSDWISNPHYGVEVDDFPL